VGDWLCDIQGQAVQNETVPIVQYVLLYSLKTLVRIERMHALQVRYRVRWWGIAQHQGQWTIGPICRDTLADTIIKSNVRDPETTAQDKGSGQTTRRRRILDTSGQGTLDRGHGPRLAADRVDRGPHQAPWRLS
jgi:hypothetical protein